MPKRSTLRLTKRIVDRLKVDDKGAATRSVTGTATRKVIHEPANRVREV